MLIPDDRKTQLVSVSHRKTLSNDEDGKGSSRKAKLDIWFGVDFDYRQEGPSWTLESMKFTTTNYKFTSLLSFDVKESSTYWLEGVFRDQQYGDLQRMRLDLTIGVEPETHRS